MKKLVALIALLLVISITPKAQAQEIQAGSSANFASQTSLRSERSDLRIVALKNVFRRYNSPLENQADNFVKYADKYEVDWKLLPSISGTESTFGQYILPNTYNAYGWGGGYIYFKDWKDGIATINQALKENYIDKGATDVYKIGAIYAESKHWPYSTSHFMDEINKEYQNLTSSKLSPDLESF